MRFYTFKLESFQINNTRSRHDDTDTVTFGLQVGHWQFPVQSLFAGNLNNGSYPINLEFGPVLITEDSTIAAFTYEIYNGGAGSLPVSLVDLNKELLDVFAPLVLRISGSESGYANFSAGEAGVDIPTGPQKDPSGNNTQDIAGTSDWSDLFYQAVAVDIGGFLFPDCDGFVAADGIGMNKQQWDNVLDTAEGDTFRQTMNYLGSDSPVGCGSNSDYSVTWSVRRETVMGSLRQFLVSHRLVLRPGLRSLAQ